MKYNPRQLHLQHNLTDTNIKTSVIQKYNVKFNEWEFATWKCQHCNTTLKFASSVVKHYNTCKELNSIKKKELNNADTNSND
jgi:phage FluMu protein Com